MNKPVLTDLPLEELQTRLEAIGERAFRAKQILKWIYGKGVTDFSKMTDLGAAFRKKLPAALDAISTRVQEERTSPDGTRKVLLRMRDGQLIETVLIPEQERRTICMSTQAGCPVGCVFCASGIGGLDRNLTSGEIIEQILHMRAVLADTERISNVVLMGVGEPLLNYVNVTRALRAMRAPWGLNMGYNRITLSTVGIVDKIRQLLKDKVTPNLAISLHAPDDAMRRRLIPNVRHWPITELIETGERYAAEARKDVTFEYVLLSGVNDERAHAEALGRRIAGRKIKVNVIPYNKVKEFFYRAPSRDRVDRFVRTLGSFKVFVSVRRRRGEQINAACGQLRLIRGGTSKGRSRSGSGRRPARPRSKSERR